MLSPGENAGLDSVKVSLFCAVTPVRRASVDAVQSGAKRDSFNQGPEVPVRILTLVAWVRANSF